MGLFRNGRCTVAGARYRMRQQLLSIATTTGSRAQDGHCELATGDVLDPEYEIRRDGDTVATP